ncbi:RteC domain-containing protein [Pedobacter rhodius]|uniref:RteC domain-containing protein n=1 Tax=Pedobacter rhodius TaxID=3004098 RepID=A0ABT4KX67_9SPHI|nr:RteC domain-containing protein [Pedobacter sp. SJ11]MCZ4223526.1 RteC domain-containing protein [Pedobacter sp. SJ11]
MLAKVSEELYTQLDEKITQILIEETDIFRSLSEILKAVRESLRQLKEYILANPFIDDDEQIWFFKYIKPKFYCLRLFYLEKYELQTIVPSANPKQIKQFYHDELATIMRFFQRNAFIYQYYRRGATELDSIYFLRGVDVQSVLLPDIPEQDCEFSTSQDYLFSKIKAYELLQEYILTQLRLLDNQISVQPTTAVKNETNRLTWTGDKTNLVEVIYGLFYTGQLNNGNATIADIIKWMEANLQIDLSRSYRNFIDIRNRKRDSPTRFLDKMRDFILQRIDEDNTYKPNRGAKLLGDKQ